MKHKMGKIVTLVVIYLTIFSILFYAINKDSKRKKNIAIARVNLQTELKTKIQKQLSEKLTNIPAKEEYLIWAKKHNLNVEIGTLEEDPDGDGLKNYLEYAHGTDPKKFDTDKDGFSDKSELERGFDPDDDGKSRLQVRVKIEKLGIDVPMIWSNSTNDGQMLKDLESGVSHYYNTASPGQIGNMIISGHSSNYSWAKGNYNNVFKDLNLLETGDEVVIDTSQKNGRNVSYKYKVIKKLITTADDQGVFAKTQNHILTLTTCWPLGTNLKRLIIQAEMSK